MCVLGGNTRPSEGVLCRGVVVRERGGTPFRQIFWSRNGAPANIVGHRWNANTEAFQQITSYSSGWLSISLFSGLNCPPNAVFGIKNLKKISYGDTPGSPQWEGATPSCTHHQHSYTPCAGAQALPLLRPGSRKPFPQIKIYHYTPGAVTVTLCDLGGYTRPSEGVLRLWHCVI